MPNFDGTGPEGRGPMTGRGMGNCAEARPRRFFRRGFGRGIGYGFRRAFNYSQDYPVNEPATFTKEEQKKILQEELKDMENEKKAIEKRLKEME